MKRIYLEITNACNLNCPFCSQNKGHSFISLKEFDDYTNQIKEVCDYLYLHVLGEPLLHPNFDKILDLLDFKDFKVQLVSNGTLLYRYPNLLKHKCLRKLSISLHSINNLNIDDTYFDTINLLIENNKDVNIELRFYDKEKLDEKLKKYLEFLYEKYDVKESKKISSFKLKEHTYIYFQNLFKWPDINDEYVSDEGKCLGLSEQLAILCNGDVTSCCLDAKGINSLGNLKKNTLIDILNSEQYITALNNLKHNKLTLELCKHCTYRSRFSKQ